MSLLDPCGPLCFRCDRSKYICFRILTQRRLQKNSDAPRGQRYPLHRQHRAFPPRPLCVISPTCFSHFSSVKCIISHNTRFLGIHPFDKQTRGRDCADVSVRDLGDDRPVVFLAGIAWSLQALSMSFPPQKNHMGRWGFCCGECSPHAISYD